MNEFDVERCRAQFPALGRRVNGDAAVFFDGPAGSQVPARVIEAIGRYLSERNANQGGVFATSRETDALIAEARRAVADLLGSGDAEAVVFGPNMTTLTMALSRALSATWKPGDEVVVTALDHDANYTPWVLAARDAGARVRAVPIRPDDCTLDLDALDAALSERTRLVAVTCASNAVGSINPVARITARAHQAGAEVFLDAVHYAPHRAMAVDTWGCDYLVASAYKFFGPHVGVLWGRRERLVELPAAKLRPAPDTAAGRWMTGTQNHEGIAGVLAAVDYLEELGGEAAAAAPHRRGRLTAAFEAIQAYESVLVERLLRGLERLERVNVWGIRDLGRLEERVPTVALRHAALTPLELAAHLAERGIFVWHGNFYALPVTEALGLEPEGLVRIGLLHYNTAEEVDRLLAALRALE